MALVGLGAGEIVGGVINGQLQDRLGARMCIFTNLVELAIGFGFLIWYTVTSDTRSYSLITDTAMNFLYGLQDSGVNNFIFCIAGF